MSPILPVDSLLLNHQGNPLIVKGTWVNVEERKVKESLWKLDSVSTSTAMLQPLTYLQTIKKSVWVTIGFYDRKNEKAAKGG